MKFGREVMPLKMTSTPYLPIPYLQAFQNGDVQTSEVDAKLAPVNVGT
jgi:hypothetical protein